MGTSWNDQKPKLIGLHIPFIVLVYQGGIANLFMVDRVVAHPFPSADRDATTRNARRLYQGDFTTAESIAYGLALAGIVVRSMACNEAGDISEREWSYDLDAQPFAEQMHPQRWN